MGTLVHTLLILVTLALRPSQAWSQPPEDLEASGDDQDQDQDLDLDLEGSGSGEVAPEVTQDEKSTRLSSSKESPVSTKRHKSTQNEPKNQEVAPWNRELTIIQESQSFLESKEVLTGVIAGGLCGLVLAVLLGGLLIYKWQKKEQLGYVRGQRQEPSGAASIRTPRGHDVVLV